MLIILRNTIGLRSATVSGECNSGEKIRHILFLFQKNIYIHTHICVMSHILYICHILYVHIYILVIGLKMYAGECGFFSSRYEKKNTSDLNGSYQDIR